MISNAPQFALPQRPPTQGGFGAGMMAPPPQAPGGPDRHLHGGANPDRDHVLIAAFAQLGRCGWSWPSVAAAVCYVSGLPGALRLEGAIATSPLNDGSRQTGENRPGIATGGYGPNVKLLDRLRCSTARGSYFGGRKTDTGGVCVQPRRFSIPDLFTAKAAKIADILGTHCSPRSMR